MLPVLRSLVMNSPCHFTYQFFQQYLAKSCRNNFKGFLGFKVTFCLDGAFFLPVVSLTGWESQGQSVKANPPCSLPLVDQREHWLPGDFLFPFFPGFTTLSELLTFDFTRLHHSRAWELCLTIHLNIMWEVVTPMHVCGVCAANQSCSGEAWPDVIISKEFFHIAPQFLYLLQRLLFKHLQRA